jgi:hypothetical protein
MCAVNVAVPAFTAYSGDMTGGPDPASTGPTFSKRQTDLIQELARRGQRFPLGAMLQGALIALYDGQNPQGLVQAAHSLRELMDKFELEMNGSSGAGSGSDATGAFFEMAKQLESDWAEAKKNSGCYDKGKAVWSGPIDAALGIYLGATEGFFVAKEADYRKRKEKKFAVLVGLDPMYSMLSQDQQDQVVAEWNRLRRLFAAAAHHSNVKRADFDAALDRLEVFLYRQTMPLEAENKNAILAYIEKVETRDK